MKPPLKVGILLFAVVIVLLIFWVSIQDVFNARHQGGLFTASLARRVRRLSVPSAARSKPNPLTATPELMTEARRHFADHCAVCHANDGSGNTVIGRNLNPPAPDMKLAPTQSMSDGELYYVIHNGIRFTGMPAWGESDPDDDSWKLVLFIRHLPDIPPEEIQDMEKYNPKSEADRAEEQGEEDFLKGKPVSPPAADTHR